MAQASKHVEVLLIHELVKYYLARGLRKGSASPGKSTESQSQSAEAHTSVKAALELHGHYLGGKIATRLTLGKGRIWDQNSCVIFVCKNLWTYLFGSNVSRLQSNSQGTYVILCETIPWLNAFGPSQSASNPSAESARPFLTNDYKLLYLHLIAGIVHGALASLGLAATVAPSIEDAYKFKVSLQG
ncbi:trafficking protein particle complex subunit 6B, putative [Babesia caballi]|uniref:Trafficking protein particle complex subunit 6B, putative n=1 Tax=Babesia caballi TaxID=5871 RepID=A0AAV4LN78_BABCB|nr:trafficking protein particle complex subunit 6B, putative [Babesia caballi]